MGRFYIVLLTNYTFVHFSFKKVQNGKLKYKYICESKCMLFSVRFTTFFLGLRMLLSFINSCIHKWMLSLKKKCPFRENIVLSFQCNEPLLVKSKVILDDKSSVGVFSSVDLTEINVNQIF